MAHLLQSPAGGPLGLHAQNRSTRQSLGCARSGTSTASSQAGSTRWSTSRVALIPPTCRPAQISGACWGSRFRGGGGGAAAAASPSRVTLTTRVQLYLATSNVTVPTRLTQPERRLLAPDFVAAWQLEALFDPVLGSIIKGAAAPVGGRGRSPRSPRHGRVESAGRWGLSVAACSTAAAKARPTARACPKGDGQWLRTRILQECLDTPRGGLFSRHKTGRLMPAEESAEPPS